MERARSEFSNYPKVVERIEAKLRSAKYDEVVKAGKQPEIHFEPDEIVCRYWTEPWLASIGLKGELLEMWRAAFFLRELPGVKITIRPLSMEEVMQKADKEFAAGPHKVDILERIKKNLIASKYQEAINLGKQPEVALTFIEDDRPRPIPAEINDGPNDFLEGLPSTKIHYVSLSDVIKKALERFANHPCKDAIVNRISSRLKAQKYRETVEAGNKPLITFTWEDQLSMGEDQGFDDIAKAVIQNATNFMRLLPGAEFRWHQ